jgi:single-strand DNA-binding protein
VNGITAEFKGNLGGDPEVGVAKNGTTYANINVASTPRVLNRETDQWENGDTTWVRVTAWGYLAERVANLTKGQQVYVKGTLTLNEFTRKNGEAGAGLSVRADEIALALPRAEGDSKPVAKKDSAPAESAEKEVAFF